MPKSQISNTNKVLTCLPKSDLRRLQADLEPVDLPVRTQLERPNQEIRYVYFPESGFASVVVDGAEKRSIEVGLIGREGMSGLAVVMSLDRSPQEVFMQSAGHGQRIVTAILRQRMEKSRKLRQCLLQFAHIFYVQCAQTCLANGRGKIEERLARWLLMAHDRLESDELALTQEFLSVMLGVRRPGVTVALGQMENQGLIQTERGRITIVDRKGLEESANGLYGVPEREFARLFN